MKRDKIIINLFRQSGGGFPILALIENKIHFKVSRFCD